MAIRFDIFDYFLWNYFQALAYINMPGRGQCQEVTANNGSIDQKLDPKHAILQKETR